LAPFAHENRDEQIEARQKLFVTIRLKTIRTREEEKEKEEEERVIKAVLKCEMMMKEEAEVPSHRIQTPNHLETNDFSVQTKTFGLHFALPALTLSTGKGKP
jgi:hypothetical protein